MRILSKRQIKEVVQRYRWPKQPDLLDLVKDVFPTYSHSAFANETNNHQAERPLSTTAFLQPMQIAFLTTEQYVDIDNDERDQQGHVC